MERVVGTVVRGLRCPIINEGDNIEEIVVDSVLKASEVEGFQMNDKDIVTLTESIVARAQEKKLLAFIRYPSFIVKKGGSKLVISTNFVAACESGTLFENILLCLSSVSRLLLRHYSHGNIEKKTPILIRCKAIKPTSVYRKGTL